MSIYSDIESEFINRFKIEQQLFGESLKEKSVNQVDFVYQSGDKNIMVEVYATIGKALSAKKRKLVSDGLKMLYLEKIKGKFFDKYIITVNDEVWKTAIEKIWQIDALKTLGITILYFDITTEQRNALLKASKENVKSQQKIDDNE